MADQLKICNMALSYLGISPLIVLDSTTVEGPKILNAWDVVLDEVLAEHPWRFATKRSALAQLATSPVGGWLYAYQINSDCVFPIEATTSTFDDDVLLETDIYWAQEGNTLVCNEEENVFLKYTSRTIEPGYFSAGFVSALSARLAAELALILSEKPTALFKAMYELYQMRLSRAKAQDNLSQNIDPGLENQWIDAR